MIEKKVVKNSVKVFSLALAICVILGIYHHTIAYATGMVIGYVISLIVFKMTVMRVDAILEHQDKSFSNGIIFVMLLGKYMIYSAGILVGIFFKEYVNFVAVFLGYFIVKMTIYANTIAERRKNIG